MPSWRLEPSAVKVARWVLRETALGNRCRPPDKNVFQMIGLKVHAGCYMLACRVSMKPTEQSGVSWFCHKSS
ncbi:hypothetical protein, partial [Vibrio crassostreae]|uniref:hypothetical protein n=1 Tax=Vibrio crassostreae TaxID=246167 RepID=UPI001A9ECD0D